MIIITSKIFKGIGGNNYTENIQRDRWEYLDKKTFKGIGGNNYIKNNSLNV